MKRWQQRKQKHQPTVTRNLKQGENSSSIPEEFTLISREKQVSLQSHPSRFASMVFLQSKDVLSMKQYKSGDEYKDFLYIDKELNDEMDDLAEAVKAAM